MVGTFDVATGQRTASPLPAEGSVPTQFAGSADGRLFALGYGDGHVVVGDVASGREVSRVRAVRDAGRSFSVSALSFNPDQTRLYVAGVGLWEFDVATGRLLAHNDDPKLANVVAGAGDVVVASYIDGRLGVFDASSLAETRAPPGAGGFV
jgi:WD40 repeat protein